MGRPDAGARVARLVRLPVELNGRFSETAAKRELSGNDAMIEAVTLWVAVESDVRGALPASPVEQRSTNPVREVEIKVPPVVTRPVIPVQQEEVLEAKPWLPVLKSLQRMHEGNPGEAWEEWLALATKYNVAPTMWRPGMAGPALQERAREMDEGNPMVER